MAEQHRRRCGGGRIVSKYMDSDEARRVRALSKLEGLLPELASMLASLKA